MNETIVPPCLWLGRFIRPRRFVTVSFGYRPRSGEEQTLLRRSSGNQLEIKKWSFDVDRVNERCSMESQVFSDRVEVWWPVGWKGMRE